MSTFEYLVWLIPAFAGLGAIWKRELGLLVLAAGLVFFGSPPGGPYLAALDVTALVVIAASLRAGTPQPTRLGWPAAVVVLVALASLVPQTYQPPSWTPGVLLGLVRAAPHVESWTALYTWRAGVDLVLGWMLFLGVRRSFNRAYVERLGLALAGGITLACGLGLLEQFHVLRLDAYRAIGPLVPTVRMHSLFFNSGWFAEYLVLATPFAVAALAATGRRYTCVVLSAMALLCVVLTEQRGAWFAATAALGFVAWTERRKLTDTRLLWRIALVGGACLVIGFGSVLLLGPETRRALRERVATATGDLAGRTQLWRAALHLTSERPLLGWGLGSFAPAYDTLHPVGSAGAQRPRGTAHNWILNAAAETGLLGVAALLLLAGTALGVLFGSLVLSRGPPRTLAIGLSASLLGAAVYAGVQYVPHLKGIHWLLWLLLGCIACLDETGACPPIRRIGVTLCLSAIVVATVRLVTLPSPDWLGNRTYGLHEIEVSSGEPFQWAEPEAAVGLSWKADCLVVGLANGHPRAARFPVRVRISAAGLESNVTPEANWRELVLPVGAPRADDLVLRLSSDRSFRPFVDLLDPNGGGERRSSDIRRLSVAVRAPRWESCSPADGLSAARSSRLGEQVLVGRVELLAGARPAEPGAGEAVSGRSEPLAQFDIGQ